ncbi:MAG: Uma2 family endonuclease [Vulcanimicrobiaceae bacterium]
MAHRAVLRYEDLQTFPDDKLRREILDGQLNVTPSPVPRHARVVGDIFRLLADHADRVGGQAFGSDVDIVLSAQNVVIPDVVYIAPDRLHTLGEKAIYGVPSLFVEVLSPSTQRIDRGKKRQTYARFGVPEYWIVDPGANTIERCSDPAGERYETVLTFDQDMPAATLPDFVLPFGKVFR